MGKFTLVVGPTVAFFALYTVVLGTSISLFDIPCSAGWSVLGDSAPKLQLVLVLSPVVGFVLGHWLSGAMQITPLGDNLRRHHFLYFCFTLLCIVLFTILCYGGAGHLLVGKVAIDRWESTVGLWTFRSIYHIAAPVIGYIGTLIVARALVSCGL